MDIFTLNALELKFLYLRMHKKLNQDMDTRKAAESQRNKGKQTESQIFSFSLLFRVEYMQTLSPIIFVSANAAIKIVQHHCPYD